MKKEKRRTGVCVYLHEPEVRAFDVGHRARILLKRLHDAEYQRPVANSAVVARARCSSLQGETQRKSIVQQQYENSNPPRSTGGAWDDVV